MTPALRLALIALNIGGGLGFEALGAHHGWLWAEPLVGAITALHLAAYLWRPPTVGGSPIARSTLVACLLLATGGELVLSAALGLYRYRASVLPVFVPPGHVLLFIAGLTCVDVAPLKRLPRLAALGVAAALALELAQGRDELSAALFATWLVCIALGPEPRLYAVMFLLALGVELLGTSVGTWRWEVAVPGLGITMANPPLAAGVFYALLDLLTLGASRLTIARASAVRT